MTSRSTPERGRQRRVLTGGHQHAPQRRPYSHSLRDTPCRARRPPDRALEILATLPFRLPALFVPIVQEFIAIRIVVRLASVGTIKPNGQRYNGGDALADIIQDVMPVDHGWVVLRTAAREVLELEQRDHLVHAYEPWVVKGTRFEIADFFNYNEPGRLSRRFDRGVPALRSCRSVDTGGHDRRAPRRLR